jgi:hypothetical protein
LQLAGALKGSGRSRAANWTRQIPRHRSSLKSKADFLSTTDAPSGPRFRICQPGFLAVARWSAWLCGILSTASYTGNGPLCDQSRRECSAPAVRAHAPKYSLSRSFAGSATPSLLVVKPPRVYFGDNPVSAIIGRCSISGYRRHNGRNTLSRVNSGLPGRPRGDYKNAKHDRAST